MKHIYWRWKNNKAWSEGWMEERAANIVAIHDHKYGRSYPMLADRNDVEIRIAEEDGE